MNQRPSPSPAAPTRQRAQRRSGGWLTIVAGILLVVLVVVAGWVFFDYYQSTTLLAAARTQYGARNYAAAAGSLQRLMSEYDRWEAASEARMLLPQVRLDWARALHAQGQYAEALALYDAVDAPNLAAEVLEGGLQARLDWGQALLESGDFAAARDQFAAVQATAAPQGGLVQFGELDARASAALPRAWLGLAEQALAMGDPIAAYGYLRSVLQAAPTEAEQEQARAIFARLAQPLYDQAQQERSREQFAAAQQKLRDILAYAPATPVATQVGAELPAFYLEWGQALARAGQFAEAAQTYRALVQTYPDSAAAPEAAQRLVDAEVAAIIGSGAAAWLPAPQASATPESQSATATYALVNETNCPLLLLMSGPDSQAVPLAANTGNDVEVAAGDYRIVVRIHAEAEGGVSSQCEAVLPFTNETTFASGIIYQSAFYLDREALEGE